MADLKDWVIDIIEDKLSEFEDERVDADADELVDLLFSGEFANGTYDLYTDDVIKWMTDYFYDIGEVLEDIKVSGGKDYVANPFKEPGRFQVQILDFYAGSLLNQCEILDRNQNREIVLDKKTINQILKELRAL